MEFSHLDAAGNARMVDVSSKPPVLRTARAAGEIRLVQKRKEPAPG